MSRLKGMETVEQAVQYLQARAQELEGLSMLGFNVVFAPIPHEIEKQGLDVARRRYWEHFVTEGDTSRTSRCIPSPTKMSSIEAIFDVLQSPDLIAEGDYRSGHSPEGCPYQQHRLYALRVYEHRSKPGKLECQNVTFCVVDPKARALYVRNRLCATVQRSRPSAKLTRDIAISRVIYVGF